MLGFRRRMVLRADDLGREVARVVKKAAIVADQVAVTETPVDTGRARANWYVTVGKTSDDVGGFDEVGERKSDARGAANAQRSLDRATAGVAPFVAGQGVRGSIFITNNVEYIGRLEEGSSAQAPQGMTRQAVEAAAAVVRRERILRR